MVLKAAAFPPIDVGRVHVLYCYHAHIVIRFYEVTLGA